jgi:hypothetical protein
MWGAAAIENPDLMRARASAAIKRFAHQRGRGTCATQPLLERLSTHDLAIVDEKLRWAIIGATDYGQKFGKLLRVTYDFCAWTL